MPDAGWERLRVEEVERNRQAAQAERRRRIEESERCSVSIDDRICSRNPSRCPCRGSGRCGKRNCRFAAARRAADTASARPTPRRTEIPACGPRHSCLAFRKNCACLVPRACPYAQCMRIGSDFPEEVLSETTPLAPRDDTETTRPDSPTLGIIRPLRSRDFGSERCETPDHRSACRLGLPCPCVFSGLCDEGGCGRAIGN